MTGVVIRILADKGFGFVKGTDNIDRFFHRSGLQVTSGLPFEQIQVGAAAEFEPIDGPKGPRAIEVLVR